MALKKAIEVLNSWDSYKHLVKEWSNPGNPDFNYHLWLCRRIRYHLGYRMYAKQRCFV